MKTSQSKTDELMEAYADEAKARDPLESMRWPNGPVCPHCKNAGQKRISKLEPRSASQSGVRQGVYFCGVCRQQFTVTVGTVLERSRSNFKMADGSVPFMRVEEIAQCQSGPPND